MAGENAENEGGNDDALETDAAADTEEFEAGFESFLNGTGPADDAQPDPAGEDEGGDDQPQGDEPPAQDSPSGDQPQGDTPKNDSDDPWKDAAPHLREAYEARERELTNRLAQMGREVQQLRQNTQPPAKADEPKKDGDEGKPEDLYSSEELKRLEEDYGEVAGPLLKILRQQDERIASLTQPVEAFSQDRAREAEERNMQELSRMAPDWTDLAKHEKFAEWRAQQPRPIAEALERNWNSIVDPNETAWAFNQFRQSLGETATPPAGDGDRDTATQKTDRSRERRLNAGKDGGKSGGAPVQHGIPDDFDAAFEAFSAKHERNRRK